MKMLIISFVFWILIIPSRLASFLILTALAAFVPIVVFRCCLVWNRHRAALPLCGPFWIIPFAVRALSIQRFAPQLSPNKFI
jgi:hypothetical protein